MAEGLEVNERIGGKGVHVIAAKYMYPFHWLMTDPNNGGSEGVVQLYPLCTFILKQDQLSPWNALSGFLNVKCFFSLSFSCATGPARSQDIRQRLFQGNQQGVSPLCMPLWLA